MARENRRAPVPPIPGFLQPAAEGFGSPLRVLILAALLGAILVAGWRVFALHRERVRGLPDRFPEPVADAQVAPLGVNAALKAYDEEELASILRTLSEGGFVWVRQTFRWSQIQAKDGATGYDWSDVDRVMEALRRHTDLRLVAVLDDEPTAPLADVDVFAAFAGAFAERYGNQVDHYQIWDEPNLAARWGGGPVNPAGYADLLSRSAEAIRAADPQARILLAGLAPTTETGPQNLSEPRYLDRLYEAGAAPYFDIVAAKPYGFDTGPADRRVDESVLNASRVLLLRDVMVKRGDEGKAIWASHWGWNALPEGWEGKPSIWGQTDEGTQAARSVAFLDRAREEWPWMGALIIENLQPEEATGETGLDDPRWGFALLAPDGSPRPVYDQIADWAAAVPNAAPVGGYPAVNRWASYGGAWRKGPLGVDPGAPPARAETGNKGTFQFDGTRVAVTVRRGPYRGFLYVTVDGQPANDLPRDASGRSYVVLYGETWERDTVSLASGLEPGAHSVELTAEGGHGQWPIIDWRVGPRPVRDRAVLRLLGLGIAGLLTLLLLFLDVRRVDWAALRDGLRSWPSRVQVGVVTGATAVLWGAAACWARVPPDSFLGGSCAVLSAVLLPVLIFLFAVRLDLGLSLVALSAPFYLVPEGLFYRALSLSELMVILCLGAVLVRRWDAEAFPGPWAEAPTEGGSASGIRGGYSLIDLGLAGLVFSAAIAGAAARETAAALFELRSVFLIPAAYYALVRFAPLDRRARRRMIDAFLLGAAGVALVGLVQVALGRNLAAAEGGLQRLQSVYHSPNSVGLYLGRAWPFLLVGALFGRGRRRRVVSLTGLALLTAAVGLSFSRGAILLAIPASIVAMGWWAGGRYRWAALAVVGAGAVILLPMMRLPRFAALLDLGEGTTFLRLKLWESSVRMIRDHPLLGVGPGNFLEAYRTRYVLPAGWEEFNLEHAHNLLLDHWTRLGVLGVGAGVALQVGFWRSVGRRRRIVALGLAGSMAAALAHGLVDNAFFFPDLALVLSLTLALAQRGW